MDDWNTVKVLRESVPGMLEQRTMYMDLFNRNSYGEAFEQFLEEQDTWLKAMGCVSGEEAADGRFLKELAEPFVQAAVKSLETAGSGSKQDKELLGINMYMVTYVLPGILECSDRKVGKILTDAICEAWGARFKHSNIQAARYADIDAGFKRKLCYITTAVCEALQMDSEGGVLSLLKQYRDDYLRHRQGGEEMIREYYDIAPTIVKRIGKTEHPREEYLALYEQYISKCVRMINEGAYEACLELYREMVLQLKDRYLVTKRQ